jgi:hypothetical protein
LKDWSNFETLLAGNRTGIAVVRALTQWTLDFSADGSNLGFPFDRPYLDLYNRCIKTRRAIDALLRKQQPNTTKAYKALKDSRGAAADLHDIHEALDFFTAALQQRRPNRGPAEDLREAIDIMVQHILRYGSSLWGHVIPLPEHAGGGIRLVERTNNPAERFFKDLKKGERQRCGRKNLTQDFETLPAGAAIVKNLLDDDYVEILCGSIDRLPEAFAELDEQKRRDRNIGIASPSFRLDAAIPEVVSASLPSEDRSIVRADAFEAAILAVACSRAPRVTL